MAIKKVAFRQPASQEHSGSENPPDNTPEENVSEKVADANPADSNPVDSDASAFANVIANLSKAIEHLSAEKKPELSRFQRFLTHPFLTSSLFVVLFTGLVGGALTYFYTSLQKEVDHQRSLQQQKLARQQSFSDELNKIRIQKIGEVWEQIDKNEMTLDSLLDKANKTPNLSNAEFGNIERIIDEDIAIVSKNRFWLGDPIYNKLKDYLDITGQYFSDMLFGPPGIDLSETLKKREKAKQDILQIRNELMTGEL